MHVVLTCKPILVHVVCEQVKLNSLKKQIIKVQQHNTGKNGIFLGLNWLLIVIWDTKHLIMAYGMKA